MSWQKLTLYLPAQLIESVDDLLNEAGAVAVTMESAKDEELFEPPPGTTPLWQHTRISGLFPVDIDLALVLSLVTQGIHPHPIPYHTQEILPDQDWQKVCTDVFQPVCFADKLWVYPSWHQPPDAKPAVILDPGVAFGTGAHPTTALCLTWLAQHIQAGQEVIDYGCGSGILAIAALKLGAHKAWAVDNDSQALEATLENASRNAIPASQLQAILADINASTRLKPGSADVLIANILANPLISLAPYLADKVKPGGSIVLSGILAGQIEMVLQAYADWFVFEPAVIQEEWVRLCGLKPRVCR